MVLSLKSYSISSKLRPRVSGKYLITKYIAKMPINANIKNTHSVLRALFNTGNNCATISVPKFNTSVAKPVAAPRARIGNISGNITQRIGPHVKPKNTINSDKHTIIITAEDSIPIVQIRIAITRSDMTIPMFPVISSFLRSILSAINTATIVTSTLIVPIPTVPRIDVASPRPALLKIVGA
ncbi:Uncharacterised protein [Mycobacteroides abscessus subsp. abscessus]|nr:Uncharacterised protein [Mycobacteroides abscessus subsp. abscessus]